MRIINLLEFFVKVSLDDNVTSKLSALTNSVGNGLASAAKIGAAGVTAAATAVAGLTKASVEAFSDFEQLAGGVSTLFGDAADAVFAYSEEAYKNAGLSANDYMETVTSFSASLIQSLDGDTTAAAEVANRAIEDMSDNANKMGTSVESIQNAYQGFAKQNYTMLDNLKLGYGGTKEEMERLIQDASGMTEEMETLGITVDATDMSFGNIVNAISVMQEHLGIAGTTSTEAATTIQGSLAMTQSAWENVLAAMSGGTEDFTLNFDTALNNLLTSAETFFVNVKPRVITALNGIATAITEFTPQLAELIPQMVESLLPALITSVTSLISGASGVIPTIIQTITTMLPTIMDAGITILEALGTGIMDNIDLLVEACVEIINGLVEYITDNAQTIIEGAIQIALALLNGLIQAIPTIAAAIPQIIQALYLALVNNAPQILEAGVKLVQSLIEGLLSYVSGIISAAGTIFEAIHGKLANLGPEARQWGADMMNSFKDGIMEKLNALAETVHTVASNIKSVLGFSEPEEGPLSNFHTYAPDMMELFAKGIRDNTDVVTDQLEKSFDFGETLIDANPTVNGTYTTVGTDVSSAVVAALQNLNLQVVMDSGELVGAIAVKTDNSLGNVSSLKGRGLCMA